MSSSSEGSVAISDPYSIDKLEDMREWRTDDNQESSKTVWLPKMFPGLMEGSGREAGAYQALGFGFSSPQLSRLLPTIGNLCKAAAL